MFQTKLQNVALDDDVGGEEPPAILQKSRIDACRSAHVCVLFTTLSSIQNHKYPWRLVFEPKATKLRTLHSTPLTIMLSMTIVRKISGFSSFSSALWYDSMYEYTVVSSLFWTPSYSRTIYSFSYRIKKAFAERWRRSLCRVSRVPSLNDAICTARRNLLLNCCNLMD